MSIGKRIKDLRKKQNLTQTKLAEKIFRSKSIVSKLENDEVELLPLVRKAICEAFAVREEWLLTGEGEKFIERGVAQAENFIIKEASPTSARATPLSGSAPGTGDFSIADDLMLAAKVLESRTHYATALHLNIRSFAAGVDDTSMRNQLNDVQTRLRDLEGKIDSLQQENKTLRTEVDRLKSTYENPEAGHSSLTDASA